MVAQDLTATVAGWIALRHPEIPDALRGLPADPDGDGAANALEFLLGTNPGTAAASDGRLPGGQITRLEDAAMWEVEFQLNPELPAWLEWEVEQSLGDTSWNWTTLPATAVRRDGSRVVISLPVEGVARYLRLKVPLP